MEDQAYHSMSSQENINWYYQARLMVIDALLMKHVFNSNQPLQIVDIGCGTGGTSIALSKYGSVVGVEPSAVAVSLIRQNIPALEVKQGTIDDLLSLLGAKRVDLAVALGVLYHRDILNPHSAVQTISKSLNSGGWFLWGDSIYPALWREHDDFVHCGRRFYPKEMHDILQQNGFEIIYSSNLLGWGTPIALGLSVLYRMRKLFASQNQKPETLQHTDDRPLPPFLNAVLKQFTYWEWKIGSLGIKIPFGVSRLILAKKRD